jgi:hypothetical protein
MHSLTQKYLKQLVFSVEELTILRTIGEYQGKQALYSTLSAMVMAEPLASLRFCYFIILTTKLADTLA